MNMTKISFFIAATIAATAPAQADVYKSVNKDGVVEYSDQPREGAEKIKVKNPQSIVLPKSSDVFTSNTSDAAEPQAPYQSVVINQPANDSAFNSGNGQVSISSETTPALMPQHSIQLVMDGTTYDSNKSGSFGLSNVDRGTHQLQVNVIDADGKVLISSDITTFTLHRPQVQRKTPRAN